MSRVEEIYQEAIELDARELAELVERLSLMLPAPQIHESWMELARARREALDSGESDLVPWEEVRERMFRRVNGG